MDREVHLKDAQIELLDDLTMVRLPSPLSGLVEVRRFSITAALLVLHHQQCRTAVVSALDGLRDYQIHQGVLAEFLIFYDLTSRLVGQLEVGTDDLLLHVTGLNCTDQPELAEQVARARDLALTIRAKRAAVEILEDLASSDMAAQVSATSSGAAKDDSPS